LKGIFTRNRTKSGAQVISVKGFTDETGMKKASIVISAMNGSHPRMTAAESRRLCDALNETWLNFYVNGEHKFEADGRSYPRNLYCKICGASEAAHRL
jgi:hypothetical protein